MRLIKTFGLAAVAAAALMAFVGVSSAMATELEEVVLCKEMNVIHCANSFPSGSKIDGELVAGTEATLNGGIFGKIKCAASTSSGTTTSALVHGEATALTFSSCKFGTQACENPEVKNLPYLAQGELNAAHSGSEVIFTEKAGAGLPEVHVKCGGLVNCTFSSASTLFTAKLETNDTVLEVNQTVNNSGGGFCPEKSVWEAKYLTRCLETGSTELKACWIEME